MVVDTNITVAYKCSSCGSLKFLYTGLFKISAFTGKMPACECSNSYIEILGRMKKTLYVSMPCIACGTNHIYSLSLDDFLGGHAELKCPLAKIFNCFVGKDAQVKARVDDMLCRYDDFLDKLGYERYYDNTQVMYDSINRIHDIALHGSLLCKCGSSDIRLTPGSDRINLQCRKCLNTKIISAASCSDVQNYLDNDYFLLP